VAYFSLVLRQITERQISERQNADFKINTVRIYPNRIARYNAGVAKNHNATSSLARFKEKIYSSTLKNDLAYRNANSKGVGLASAVGCRDGVGIVSFLTF
jgi:hypothetical protein